jgi:hypothetical protein
LKTEPEDKCELAKQNKNKNFDQILVDAIDEALSNLGENVKVAVYVQLENFFNIKKQEIPSELRDFSKALEQIFGFGVRFLEIMFVQNRHGKIKITCKWPEYEWSLSKWIVPEVTFQEYVHLMQQDFKAPNHSNIESGVFWKLM